MSHITFRAGILLTVCTAFFSCLCSCSSQKSDRSDQTRYSQEPPSVPITSGKSRPDIILISIDTLRADRLGLYGYFFDTSPNIDAFAREAVVFKRHHAQAPLTLPSHTSMLTGLEPRHHGVHSNQRYRLKPEALTLAELLKDQGYRTGAFVSAQVLHPVFGLDQGFDVYYGDSSVSRSNKGTYVPAETTTTRAIEWLKKLDTDKPFFLFVHYFDPHMPYHPPPRFEFPDPYDNELRYADEQIGRLFEFLQQTGRYQEALCVITADHGQSLGEHDLRGHTTILYEQTLHIPLVIRFPGGMNGGRSIDMMTRSTDLLPTLMGFLHIETDIDCDGINLYDIIQGSEEPVDLDSYAETRYLRHPAVHQIALISGRWKLISKYNLPPTENIAETYENYLTDRIRNIDEDVFQSFLDDIRANPKARLLFDLEQDPAERKDLYFTEPSIAEHMEKKLKVFTHDEKHLNWGEAFEPGDEIIEDLKALGYVDPLSGTK